MAVIAIADLTVMCLMVVLNLRVYFAAIRQARRIEVSYTALILTVNSAINPIISHVTIPKVKNASRKHLAGFMGRRTTRIELIDL